MNLRFHGDTLARAGALDFATCVWPAAPPAPLIGALARGLDECDRYPDERFAREQIAARHGRQPEEVLLLNGACEAFWLLAHALRPARAACVHPSFTEPEAALPAVGTKVVRVPLDRDSWCLDPSRIPDDAELVVIGCAADHATPHRVAAEVAAARADLLDALSARPGLRAWPSAANFLLLRTDDADLAGALAGEGIAVRPANSFPGLGERYIRIAVRPPADNARLLAALDEALAR